MVIALAVYTKKCRPGLSFENIIDVFNTCIIVPDENK